MNMQDNQIKVTRRPFENLSLEPEAPASIRLRIKTDTEIGSHQVRHVEVECDDYDGDIYVERRDRNVPGREHYVERGVTCAKNGMVQIVNTSGRPITYRKSDIVARGVPCQPDDDITNESNIDVLTVDVFAPFVEADLDDLVQQDVSTEHKLRLLNLMSIVNVSPRTWQNWKGVTKQR
ncbi:hypothetical protein QE152_g23557 [Popillia japonica]|uniref:Uncharacterized protein n=1 Tax=Popillia japonica TaxID=7064 RepID=A0AAW1KGL3_POPJA